MIYYKDKKDYQNNYVITQANYIYMPYQENPMNRIYRFADKAYFSSQDEFKQHVVEKFKNNRNLFPQAVYEQLEKHTEKLSYQDINVNNLDLTKNCYTSSDLMDFNCHIIITSKNAEELSNIFTLARFNQIKEYLNYIGNNPHTPTHILEELSEHPEKHIRQAVSLNTKLPQYIAEKMVADEDKLIAKYAIERLKVIAVEEYLATIDRIENLDKTEKKTTIKSRKP